MGNHELPRKGRLEVSDLQRTLGEKKFDYDRELGVSVQGLMGLKKNVYNSVDFGVLTLSTYATTH